ncbi:hypothetical protein HDV00_009710 [Rhizophlyctis rosea]|nr:hypothetical protein HDV00_009710 [Rhizophlyctis rosea]
MSQVLRHLTPLTAINPDTPEFSHTSRDSDGDLSSEANNMDQPSQVKALTSMTAVPVTPPTHEFDSWLEASPVPSIANCSSGSGSPMQAVVSAAEHADNQQAWDVLPTRNLIVKNVSESVQLTEVAQLMEPFGAIRHIFRPRKAHLGRDVVIVMFYDLGQAFIAHTSVQHQQLTADGPIRISFATLEDLTRCVAHDGSQVDDALIRCLTNQGEVEVEILLGEAAPAFERIKSFGPVRSIRESHSSHKYIAEFYDTRVAEHVIAQLEHAQSIQGTCVRAELYLPSSISEMMRKPTDVKDHPQRSSRTEQTLSLSPFAHGSETRSAKPTDFLNSYESWPSVFAKSSLHHGFPDPASTHRSAADSSYSPATTSLDSSRSHRQSLKIDTHPPTRQNSAYFTGSLSASLNQLAVRSENEAMPDPSLRVSARSSGSTTPESFGSMSIQGLPKQSSGRNEANIYDIAMGQDHRTTFMIRNIPNKYTQQMLIEFLNETHKGQYNFLYLRMDFKNHCNVGYAFINFVGPSAIISFIERAVGKRWAKFNSDKICLLSYANIQGKEALIEKFRNSSVMLEHPSYRPKMFYTDGPLIGEEEPFPAPTTKVRKGAGSDVLYSRDNAWSHLRSPTPSSLTSTSPVTPRYSLFGDESKVPDVDDRVLGVKYGF